MAETHNGHGRVQIMIRSVDPALLRRILADADENGSNKTEVATRILARHYGVTYEAKGLRRASGADESLVLRVPVELANRIYADLEAKSKAAREASAGGSHVPAPELRRLVQEILARHYGIRLAATVRRRGRRASRAAA